MREESIYPCVEHRHVRQQTEINLMHGKTLKLIYKYCSVNISVLVTLTCSRKAMTDNMLNTDT